MAGKKAKLKPKVNERFKELYARVRSQPIARILYDDFLTDTEKRKVTYEPKSLMKLVPICAKLRRLSPERVLLDMAFEVKVLEAGEYQGLRREIGEPIERTASSRGRAKTKVVTLTPVWDASRGKLLLGKKVIRTVRVCSTPSRKQMILDAFQDANWASCIRVPFKGDMGQSALHTIVNELNRGLSQMRFHVQGGAKEITWDFLKPK